MAQMVKNLPADGKESVGDPGLIPGLGSFP